MTGEKEKSVSLDQLIQLSVEPIEDFEHKLGILIKHHRMQGESTEDILRALDLYVQFVSEDEDRNG